MGTGDLNKTKYDSCVKCIYNLFLFSCTCAYDLMHFLAVFRLNMICTLVRIALFEMLLETF